MGRAGLVFCEVLVYYYLQINLYVVVVLNTFRHVDNSLSFNLRIQHTFFLLFFLCIFHFH